MLKGFLTLTRRDSLTECSRDLDCQHPVVSKFGMVGKTKLGKTEHRLIFHSKESGVARCSDKN